jgi:ABC-2 type transport system permease protein
MEQIRNSPQFLQILETVFPGIDYASAGGFLQLLFVEFGVILAGLAAATFVNIWASDETSGRLEMVLATPLSRVRWALAGGVGMLVNVGIFVFLTALGIGIGISSASGDLLTPLAGSLILGVYAAALVGIGMAVGGTSRTGWAAPVVVVFVITTWALQLFGGLFNLPEFIQGLALTTHFGQPMVGVWDWTGLAASAVLAVGGILLGTWGFKRRDLRF